MAKRYQAQDLVIGARLRDMRRAAGLSQTEVGDAVGVTFQQIQKYENGKNRVSGSTMVELCKLLKTTPDILCGVKSNGKTTESSVDLLGDPLIRRALEALHRLPEKRRAAVVRALAALSEAFQ